MGKHVWGKLDSGDALRTAACLMVGALLCGVYALPGIATADFAARGYQLALIFGSSAYVLAGLGVAHRLAAKQAKKPSRNSSSNSPVAPAFKPLFVALFAPLLAPFGDFKDNANTHVLLYQKIGKIDTPGR